MGVQALVAALPMLHGVSGEVLHLFHRTGAKRQMPEHICKLIHSQQVSEVLVIDVAEEGVGQGFNSVLLDTVQAHTDLPLLALAVLPAMIRFGHYLNGLRWRVLLLVTLLIIANILFVISRAD